MIKTRITRRQFSNGACRLGAAAGMCPAFARAQQNYPSRPVRFILPFRRRGRRRHHLAAGRGEARRQARAAVRGGKSAGPGRHRGGARRALAAARRLYDRPRHQRHLDQRRHLQGAAVRSGEVFATISTIGSFDLVFATNAESEFKTLQDFIKAAREQPGKLNVGTINVGGTQNLAAELFKSLAGLNFQIVPYRGTPDVIVALLRNDVQMHGRVLCPDEVDAARQQDPRGRHLGHPALAVPRRRSHGRPGRRCGLRGDLVERPVRSGRDAGGDHQPVEQDDPRDRGDARSEAALRGSRHRSPGQHARAVEGAACRATSRNGRRSSSAPAFRSNRGASSPARDGGLAED